MRAGQTFSSVYLAKIGKNKSRQKEKHMGDKMININQTIANDGPQLLVIVCQECLVDFLAYIFLVYMCFKKV